MSKRWSDDIWDDLPPPIREAYVTLSYAQSPYTRGELPADVLNGIDAFMAAVDDHCTVVEQEAS